MTENGVVPQRPFQIGVFHLGADLAASAPTTGLPDDAATVLAALAAKGETTVNRVYHLDRGYAGLVEKLTACGADIARLQGQRAAAEE